MFCIPNGRCYGLRRCTILTPPLPPPSGRGGDWECSQFLSAYYAVREPLRCLAACIRRPIVLHPGRPLLRLAPLYNLYPPSKSPSSGGRLAVARCTRFWWSQRPVCQKPDCSPAAIDVSPFGLRSYYAASAVTEIVSVLWNIPPALNILRGASQLSATA